MYCYNCMSPIGDDGYCPHCKKKSIPDNISHHLKPGTVLNGKFIVGNALGEGGFGITYIGRDITLDIKVAIKEYYPTGYVNRNNTFDNTIRPTTEKQRIIFDKGKERFLQEARSLAKFIDEKGVVQVREFFECFGSAYIVMEYLDGVNLNDCLKKFRTIDPDKIFPLMLPIMTSLEKMHAAGIIHRDISPDNIMFLRDGTLKLMDFGSARFFTNGEKEMSVMIKQGYAPEEQYRRNGNQGPWTDVYGLCATIYKCITGVVPDDSLNRAHIDTLQKPSELGVRIDPKLETALMYGLAVHCEDRCQNMAELKMLVKTALVKEQKAVYDNRDNKTVLKDEPDDYLTHPVDGETFANGNRYDQPRVYPPQNMQPRNMPRNMPPNMPPNMPRNMPQNENKKSVLPVVLISVGVFLLVVLGVVIFVLLDPFSDKGGGTTSSSQQDKMIQVPDVVGMNSDKALDTLSQHDLVAEAEMWPDSSHEKDQVIKQYPEQGSYVSRGDVVKIYIADGSSQDVSIPDPEPTKAQVETTADIPPVTDDDPSEGYMVYPHNEGDTLYCDAQGSIALRSFESRFADSLATINSRDAVTYLDSVYDFYKVKYNGQVGYVLAEYFSDDPQAPLRGGEGIYVNGTTLFCRSKDYLTLRESPDYSSAEIAKIPSRQRVTFIKDDEGNGEFAKIVYNGQTGYVVGKYLYDYKYADLVAVPH